MSSWRLGLGDGMSSLVREQAYGERWKNFHDFAIQGSGACREVVFGGAIAPLLGTPRIPGALTFSVRKTCNYFHSAPGKFLSAPVKLRKIWGAKEFTLARKKLS